jgi:hypothetical protein
MRQRICVTCICLGCHGTWTEHIYYTMTGVGSDLESIRRLGRQWLDKGQVCARPQSVANLPWPA